MNLYKIVGIGLLCLCLTGLFGCTHGSGNITNPGSTDQPQQNTGNTDGDQPSGTDQNGDADTGSNNDSDGSTSFDKAPSTQQEAMEDIAAAIQTKATVMLPTEVVMADGNYLTALTKSEMWYYQVKLLESNAPTKINAQSDGKLIATVEGTEYKDEASAAAAIQGYEKVDPPQDLAVDLGHGIQAITEGATGHIYTMWNEGRWCIRINSPSDPTYANPDYKDPKKLAKEIVTYLDTHALPAPQKIGVITVDIWDTSTLTTVEWQNHEMVYQVTSEGPMIALKTAVAMKLASK